MKQFLIDTVTSKFSADGFQKFSIELFNDLKINEKALEIKPTYRDHIDEFKLIGEYKDPEGKQLHVLQVKLKDSSKLDNARTAQRNIIATHLKDHWLDGALVAFYAPASTSWRLSFVKIEYKFDKKSKTKEEITPPKRFSFLVGENEPCHTAQQQLLPLIEETNYNPTLSQIEYAFNVERITKDFFAKYKKLFEMLVTELNGNQTFKNEASKSNINTENFTKKLLGQIVFLYFLQKKGWLGVLAGKSWGQGDKFFLRHLFESSQSSNKNFFNDSLEVLFYDTLNNPRRNTTDPSYSKRFDCRVPFLNGGLFEPEYDWKGSFIYLNDDIFKEILDVFDLYNFTVKEDEPLDKEVAVDPEMLGKVFENLLEENLRKGKGTYYTPREIVHYMCQESLINYLDSSSSIGRDKAEQYVKFLRGDEEKKPKTIAAFEGEAVELDKLLADIKIVDPACGSGAFLVGMLNEIVRVRLILRLLHPSKLPEQKEYELKKETIQNCVYGVDIDPGAVEIAKLRLWLSLVVDYDLEEIEPLPNLDYKVMQGNSLLEEYEGINFYGEGKKQDGLFVDPVRKKKKEELKKKKQKYFSISDVEEKEKLRKEINKLIDWFVMSSLEKVKKNIVSLRKKEEEKQNQLKGKDKEKYWEQWISRFSLEGKIDDLLKKIHDPKAEKPFFLWKLNFMEVFEMNGKSGFDIVIANPPYGANIDDMVEVYKKSYTEVIKNYVDIFKIFFSLGLKICKKSGIVTYITPNTFLAQPRYKDLRIFLLNFNIYKIVNLGEEVFIGVTVPVSITMVKNQEPTGNYYFTDISFHNKFTGNLLDIKFNKILTNDILKFKDASLLQKISLKSDELYFDFVLEIKDAGIQYHRSGIGLKNKGGNDLYDRLFSDNKNTFKHQQPTWYGKLIDTYYISPTTNEFFNLNYKNILRNNEDVSFSDVAFTQKNKILWRQTASYLRATLDAKGVWFRNTIQCCWLRSQYKNVFDIKYILAIMNSSYINYLYNKLVSESGRAFPQIKITHVKKLPLKNIDKNKQKPFVEIVNKILTITKAEDYLKNEAKQKKIREYEKKIDQLVYKIYGLTEEEIKIVENR